MIETTIAGFWHSHAKSLLAVVLLGGCLPQFNAQIAVETPDLKETQDRLEARSNETGRELIAVVLPLEVDFFDAASFVETNGRRVWSLNVDAPGALATCLYFDDFHLPLGSELFFETPEGVYEKTWVEGPVTAIENNQHRRWSNNEVPGESLTMIYSCPIGVTEEDALGINGLGFFVRHQNFPSPWSQADARVGSGDCHVDVNCPEGDSWECEKDAVVRLRTTFFDESLNQTVGGLCSGSMVNNTARDCRQLMLSAFHCVNDLEEDDWAVFKVQFNYEYSECGGTSSINSRTRTGAIIDQQQYMVAGSMPFQEVILCLQKWKIQSPRTGTHFMPVGTPQRPIPTVRWASTTQTGIGRRFPPSTACPQQFQLPMQRVHIGMLNGHPQNRGLG